jgi:NAD(P)-dependent dehydrogenase (short-subunit alcohol dehydrogenase family)
MTSHGQVVIVTGGASGIGRALCEELGRRGATIVVADIQFEVAQSVAAGINASGGSASAVHVDVRQEADVRAVVDTTVRDHGRLDCMFNNAGIGVGGEIRELTTEHWRTVIDVNLIGVINGVTAAYPVMLRQRAGHIVNIASLAGLISSPCMGPYATTKAAVVSLTSALRAEGEAFGVRASVVCPGFVDTKIFDSAIGVRYDKQDLLDKMGLPLLPVTEAALAILRGVERNQRIIVFPWSARLLWWLTRFSPWLLTPIQRRRVARLRSVRRSHDSRAVL